MMVVGPSGSGKTYVVSQMLKKHGEIFKPNFEQFVYFYNHFQPVYEELQLALGAHTFRLCQGVDWSILDKVTASNKQTLLIFDDVYQEVPEPRNFWTPSKVALISFETQLVSTILKLKNHRFKCDTDATPSKPTRHESN